MRTWSRWEESDGDGEIDTANYVGDEGRRIARVLIQCLVNGDAQGRSDDGFQ